MLPLALIALLQAPDAEAVAKAGAASLDKFATKAASWVSETTVEGGLSIRIETLRSGDRSRWHVTFAHGGKTGELARVIERDGVWFATDELGSGKYRPNEAPFALPNLYLFLSRADTRFIVDSELLKSAVFEGVEKGIATYRQPAPDGVRASLENALKTFEQLEKSDPQRYEKEGVKARADQAREILAKGYPLRVEVGTGLVVEAGTQKLWTTWRDFRWLEKVRDDEFAVDGRKWTDHTADPTKGDVGELLTVGRSVIWRPVWAKIPEVDYCLINMKTGDVRRVPCAGTIAGPGCFTKDRTAIIVPELTEDGRVTLFHVDLRTGGNRELGGNLLTGGFTLMPVLSPDGRKVAATQLAGTPEFRVVVVDLESGMAKYVGKAMNIAFLSWLPDSSGFILLRRQMKSMDEPPDTFVAKMDMAGKVTDIRPGGEPLLLADGKTILFQDDQEWKTCNLEGKNEKLFGDGLRGHAMPSLGPDGKRIAFLRARPGKEPHIVLFSVDGVEEKTVLREPGLWVYPAWK